MSILIAKTSSCNNYLLNNAFNAAIYCRLSREDDDRNSKESESIQNQREYLTKICIEYGWKLVDVYIDDGYSGTNFDRPDFQRMIADIECKKVNLVLVKDLSRLGRDYIMTGHYLEKYFPSKNVRFVAVNDGVDTFTDDSNNDMSPFRSVINDMYAKDISKKVKSVMDSKRFAGKFIGSFSPYGYLKNPDDKNKLIVDPNTAPIVKRIFEMYLHGYGYSFISNTLNFEGIKSPVQYKAEVCKYRNPKSRLGLWTHETVKNILSNPTYAGHLSQNKCKKVNYKVKEQKRVPKSAWIIVKNTHEPIVSDEVFDRVQQLVGIKTSAELNENHSSHLFSGILFCADCKERMTFTKTQKGEIYAICSTYKRFAKLHRCTRHSIQERVLNEYVLADLRRISELTVDSRKLLDAAVSRWSKSKTNNDISLEVNRINNNLLEIKNSILRLYEDKLKGIITEADFIDLSKHFNQQREQLAKQLENTTMKVEKMKETDTRSDYLLELVKSLTHFDSINKATLVKFIDKIEVYEGNKIKIHYRFKNPF